jgi:hypothetical protein
MQEITDQARDIIMMGNLTQIGVLLGNNPIKMPKIATGSMQ